MKHGFSKKAVSVLLSVLMILSSAPLTAFAVVGDKNDLIDLMTQYEDMMDGTVYTNMSEAYEAYVHGQAVLDSYRHGNNDSVSFYEAARRMEAAKANLSVWTPATASAVPSFEDDSTGDGYSYTIDGHTYYNNLIYTEPGYSSEDNAGSGDVKDVEVWMYYPETVMMYTGQSSLPEMPIMLKAKDNVNGAALWGYDRYVIAYYPVTSSNEPTDDFYLTGNWNAGIGKSNRTLDWPWTMSGPEEERGTTKTPLATNLYDDFDSENYYSLLLTPQSGFSDYRASLANSIVFSGEYFNTPFDASEVNYYDSYMATYYPKFCLVAGQDSNNTTYISGTTAIRILNYKFICDAIENRKSILSQVSSYKRGDLSTIMQGFDKLTVDPNSFFTSSNDYVSCLVNYRNGGEMAYSSPTNYGDRYQKFIDLLSATNYYGDTPADIRNYPQATDGTYGGYNGVAWEKYKTIYDNAIDTFNKIVTDGYNNSIDDVYNALYSEFFNMSKEGRIDVESAGAIVTMSHNIYTHAEGKNYNYYGQEISDNYNYDANDAANSGERVTYIDIKYPYFISPTNATAVYCLSDQTLPNGYSKGSYLAAVMNDGKWTDGTNTYTDAQVAAMTESQQGNIYMRYYLTGKVSDYFAYTDGSYQEGAIQLLINYVVKSEYDAAEDKSLVKSYGEYEFPYVMANPSMAHQIIGVRNQYNGAASYASRKTGTVYFGRFLGSEGKASDIMSNLTFNTAYYDLQQSMNASDSPYKSGTGVFNYLDTFGSDKSLYFQEGEGKTYNEQYVLPDGTTGNGSATAEVGKSRYSSPLLTGKQFTFMSESDGINSGSYSMLEHDDDGYPDGVDNNQKNVSTPNTANVVDVDYYIDYSDTDNTNIKYKADGTPYYSFELDESNIYWESKSASKGATSYFNVFGDLATKYYNNDVTIDYATKNVKSGTSMFDTSANIEFTWSTFKYYYTQNEFFLDSLAGQTTSNYYVGFEITPEMGNTSPYSTRLQLLGIDKNTLGITTNKNDALSTTGSKRGFSQLPKLDKNTSNNASNAWTGSVTFTGTDTITKQTDKTSAETYANYILEMGTVTQIDNVGFVYSASEDTYQYYNIGVATCDKTAIRTFLEKYVNKQLVLDENRNVVLDENGEPTIKIDAEHPTGDIKSGDYSFSTYQTYLDAIADIYEFVGNYKDTKIGDSSDGNITAYNSDGTPIYTDAKTGDDILKEQSNVKTDEEQIALIQAVIDAYNDLLDIDAYDDFADEYKKTIDDLEEDGDIEITPDPSATDASGNVVINVNVNDDKYTQKSVDDLSKALTIANSYYDYYKNPDAPEADKNYWRETPLSYEDYETLNQIVESAADALKEKIDNVDYVQELSNKESILQGGIGDEYTMKSWLALKDQYDASDAINNNCYDEDGELKAKYVDDSATAVTYTFRDVDYSYVNQSTQLSDEQLAVDNDLPVLQAANLKPVDKASTYQTFEIVAQVVKDMDRGKYTDEGLALVDSLYNQLMTGEDASAPSVYIYITEDQALLYNNITGQTTERSKLKATTYDESNGGSETDKLSAQLLDLVNTLDENYYNEFKAYLTVQDQDGNIIDEVSDIQVDQGKYGEVLTIDASSYCADGKSIKWTLTTYDQNNKAIGSSKKLSSYYGTKLELKADANVHATAILTDELPQDVWTVYVYNYYSNVTDVKYLLKADYPDLDTMTGTEIANITGVTAAYLPFYTFTEFTSVPTDDSTIYLRPNYTAEKTATVSLGSEGITFGHIDQPVTKQDTATMAKFGTGVTINYTGSDFFAYAAKPEGSDKYRIVSYNANYQFAAYENETYYVVTYKVDGDLEQGFKILNGEDLTPSNVEGVHVPSGVARTEQECLNFMIGYKEPFVYTQTYSAYNDGTNDMLRCYFRVTAGSEAKTQAVGVSYLANNTEVIRNIDNIASSGQFTVSVRKDGITYKKLPMRAYVTYAYTYTFYAYDGTETKQLVNTTAYSAWTYDKSLDA